MPTEKPVEQDAESAARDLSQVLGTAPPGAWVALSKDKSRIVGTGLSAQAATYQAQLRGEFSPVLMQMPSQEEKLAAEVR
jgi:hypothetical protein